MARVTKAAIRLVCNNQYTRCKQQDINPSDCIFSFDDYENTQGMTDKQWIYAIEYWSSIIGEPVPSWIYEPITFPELSFGG